MNGGQGGPQVSVIVAAYNAEKYLERALDDILGQTFDAFELICVDDCSNDSTPAILQRVAHVDARVRVLTFDTNRGGGAARNAGLAVAQGEYVLFLDADDLFEPHMLEIAVREAHTKNLDLLVFGSQALDERTGERTNLDSAIRTTLLPQSEVFCAEDIQRDVFRALTWWAWDKLIKRSLIETHGLLFQEIRSSNDLFFSAAAFLSASRVAYTKEVLLTHRFAVKGSVSNTRSQSYECCCVALDGLKSFLIERGIYARRRDDIVNYALSFLEWHINTIEGESYFALYELIRGFFSKFDENTVTFYDPQLREVFARWRTMSALDYLFRLKSVFCDDVDATRRTLARVEAQLAERNSEIETANVQLGEARASLEAAHNDFRKALGEKDQVLLAKEVANEELDAALKQQFTATQLELDGLRANVAACEDRIRELERAYESVLGSSSWRLTAPLRAARRLMQGS